MAFIWRAFFVRTYAIFIKQGSDLVLQHSTNTFIRYEMNLLKWINKYNLRSESLLLK